jgi:hypothetical protein
MGGVVNLIARRPTERSEEFLLNRSTRGATDALAYLSEPLPSGWGATVLTGGHWQSQNDINADGLNLEVTRQGGTNNRRLRSDAAQCASVQRRRENPGSALM